MKKYNEKNFLSMADSPENEEEARNYATALAQGNYPAGLDACFCIGISGGCGRGCYVIKDGDCKLVEEHFENKNVTDEELKAFYDDCCYRDEIIGWLKLHNRNPDEVLK